MNYIDYLSGSSFRFVKPHIIVPRGFHVFEKLLKILRISVEEIDTKIPCDDRNMKRTLRDTHKIPRMSTLVIGAMINRGVSDARNRASWLLTMRNTISSAICPSNFSEKEGTIVLENRCGIQSGGSCGTARFRRVEPERGLITELRIQNEEE